MLKAYIYVANTQEGKTVHTIFLPIEQREKPADYKSQAELHALQQLVEFKADDMVLDQGVLQLFAKGKGIGRKIRLPNGIQGGREIEITNDGIFIKWRYTDSNDWINLVSLSMITRAAGYEIAVF